VLTKVAVSDLGAHEVEPLAVATKQFRKLLTSEERRFIISLLCC